MPNKLLFFFLFFLLSAGVVFANASVGPYCNNKIKQNLLYKIDNTFPQVIEVKINNYKKWQKNNFRLIRDVVNEGVYGDISEKLKKKFKATIHVKFDDKIKCSFKARVRQHGDFHDHIKLIGGKVFQSLDVELKTGHINGIVRFKLLIPETRRKPEEEVILTELLRELNFLAPRTNFVKVKLNDLTSRMLFQEKAEKELLEYHHRREGPILEGNEIYMSKGIGDSGGNINSILLARQINSKWSTRSVQHENISHEALTKLNRFYLLNRNGYGYGNINPNYYVSWQYLDNNLLAPNNLEQIKKLDIYNAILFSTYAVHGLIPHNRQFYWNAINNYFEPIYYDGFLNISLGYYEPRNLPNKTYFLTAIKDAKQQIKQINIDNFFQKIKSRGSLLTKREVKKKLDQIIKNLNKLKIKINEKQDIQNKNISISDGILSSYIDSTLKLKETRSNLYLVFRDPKSKVYKACKNTTLVCDQINLTSNEIKDLLRSRLTMNNDTYQYIGEYYGVKGNLAPEELNKADLAKYKKDKIQNTEFYHDNNVTYEYDEENSVINIYQKYSEARAYFLGGSIKNISINFAGLPVPVNANLKNYPFDKNGLTGCLSFIDLNLQNISIKSSDSNCEDSINFINTTGYIKNIKINNSYGDALDIDYSNIKIDKAYISKANNDCIDLSSGRYELGELNLSECGDKALSVGEKSLVKLKDLQVLKSAIGLSSKDSSIISINKARIRKTELCFEAKRKKQEFSGGIINLNHHNCNDSPINIDPGSYINYY
jgi:hypothetical protein